MYFVKRESSLKHEKRIIPEFLYWLISQSQSWFIAFLRTRGTRMLCHGFWIGKILGFHLWKNVSDQNLSLHTSFYWLRWGSLESWKCQKCHSMGMFFSVSKFQSMRENFCNFHIVDLKVETMYHGWLIWAGTSRISTVRKYFLT